MSRKRVAVTGVGAISAAGPDVPSLVEGMTRASRLFGPNQKYDLDFDVSIGQVDEAFVPSHRFAEFDSPTGGLCLKAAKECLEDALSRGGSHPDGLSLGTSTGGQSKNEEALSSLLVGDEPPKFNYRKQGCMAAATRLVAADLEIFGPQQTVSTACTSSANSIILGATWIKSGRCERVLTGGGDALCRTTISGFHILGLTGPKVCTPFGEGRPGMTLGEGAGFLMLEDLEAVRESGREPLAELIGWGMSSDAHHMTAPPEDGAGAELAIRRALAEAGIDSGSVDHVNAHGTGTELNDAAEAQAINRVLGSQVPVMSCKGLVGHTLGGAGGIEAVVSVISVRDRRAFENIGAKQASSDCPISLVEPGGQELGPRPIVLSNSFAFGGNNCSLIFKAASEGK